MSRQLKRAIDSGDVDRVGQLLAQNPSVATSLISWGSMLCPCKTEPLHYLSDAPFNQLWDHGRQTEMARLLIDAGAPVDGLPTSGETPLHAAASLGEAGLAEVLIDHGANLESVATYPGIPDGTPLDFAVHFGMVNVIEVLVRYGAKILSLRMAAGVGHVDRIQESWPIPNDQLSDVLRCAAVCGRIDILKFLLHNEVAVDTPLDDHGATMLHWAAWEAKPDMVGFLLSHGADPDRKDRKHNLTPYGWAKHRRNELGPRWGHDDAMRILEANRRSSSA